MKLKLLTILAVLVLAGSALAMPAGTAGGTTYFGETEDPISFLYGVYYDQDNHWGSNVGFAVSIGKGFYLIPQFGYSKNETGNITADGNVAWLTPITWKLYGGFLFAPASAEFYDNPDLLYVTNAFGLVVGISPTEKVSFGLAGKYAQPYDSESLLEPDWTVAAYFSIDL